MLVWLLVGFVLGLAVAWNTWTTQPEWFKTAYDYTLAWVVKAYKAVKAYFDDLFNRNQG